MKQLQFVAAIALAILGAPAQAIMNVDPCMASGNSRFTPAHPGPTDSVELYSTLWAGDVQPDGARVVAAADVHAGSAITLDIVITMDPKRFPRYRIVGKVSNDRFAVLPALAPGVYQVNTQVRYDDVKTASIVQLCPEKTLQLTVHPVAGATMTGPVVEYYHSGLDHFFITQDSREIADLDNGVHGGWARAGGSFAAYLPNQSDQRGRQVCRFYGLPSGQINSHFYSADWSECAVMGSRFNDKWARESANVFEIALPDTLTGDCPTDTDPVYRLWNGRIDSNHRYTTDVMVRAQMIANGYVSEGYGDNGVVMCAVAGGK